MMIKTSGFNTAVQAINAKAMDDFERLTHPEPDDGPFDTYMREKLKTILVHTHQVEIEFDGVAVPVLAPLSR